MKPINQTWRYQQEWPKACNNKRNKKSSSKVKSLKSTKEKKEDKMIKQRKRSTSNASETKRKRRSKTNQLTHKGWRKQISVSLHNCRRNDHTSPLINNKEARSLQVDMGPLSHTPEHSADLHEAIILELITYHTASDKAQQQISLPAQVTAEEEVR